MRFSLARLVKAVIVSLVADLESVWSGGKLIQWGHILQKFKEFKHIFRKTQANLTELSNLQWVPGPPLTITWVRP